MNLRYLVFSLIAALTFALAACIPTTSHNADTPHAGADAGAPAALAQTPADEPEASRAPRPDTERGIAAGQAEPMPLQSIRSRLPPPGLPPPQIDNRENYAHYDDNPVHLAAEQPLSTFGLDVDTGSYTNVRRMLQGGRLPPADAVRAEEFLNYFDYDYPAPTDSTTPFRVTTELASAPWNPQRQLLLIGVQGYRVPTASIPAANLVFLVDVSGSMSAPDKLPLLKAGLKQLVRQMRANDRIAIVTYAGNAGIALPSTRGNRQARILAAIDTLQASGSTNGGAGIDLAYAEAMRHFVAGGVNRVILATDGDFNVGTTDIDALKDRIADKRRSGIALDTLGFGQGNYNDAMAVALADTGNGSHHYIDSLDEARRVLVQSMSTTLLTIAADAKVQIEFNPALVREYRLIGYVKRVLRREDFNNDKIDAGDIGAGANVTALYEITPMDSTAPRIDPLRFQPAQHTSSHESEMAWLRLRYKKPGETQSRLVERAITRTDSPDQGSERLRFAAAVAAFAEALRHDSNIGTFTLTDIAKLARGARGDDADGRRAEFVRLVTLADSLRTPLADDTTAALR